MKDVIKVDSIFLEYRNIKILRGAVLKIESNQIIGILGRNGCGKSCFLKIIIGQIQPQDKYISYNDKPLSNLYKKKGLINYLPQHEFHPKSISLHNILNYYGIDVDEFLEQYPFLRERLKVKFSNLSGGEKRLVEVLVVLESESKFTILDEPFSHIMPKYIEVVKERIQELKTRKGIVITDHQYRNVIDISDELYLMRDGIMHKVRSEEDLRLKGYIL